MKCLGSSEACQFRGEPHLFVGKEVFDLAFEDEWNLFRNEWGGAFQPVRTVKKGKVVEKHGMTLYGEW